MKTTRLTLLIVISTWLLSCGGSEKNIGSENEIQNSDTVLVDSVIVDTLIQLELDPTRPKIDLEDLLAKSENEFELPISIDSIFIEKYINIDESDYPALTYKEAQFLEHSLAEGEITSYSSYDISRFIELDSIDNAGAMDDYLSTLDIGMARYSNANVIGEIRLNSQQYLFLWVTDYATYEACPYGSGTCVFGTLFSNDVATTTILLAENSGGGDPPVWGETMVTSEIRDSTILVKKMSRYGEEDWETGEEIIDEDKNEETFSIEGNGIKLKKIILY